MIKEYLNLLRVKHYIKNFLVFVPLFFEQKIFDFSKFKVDFWGCVGFCFISSAVYILNDLKDIEMDQSHPTKRKRPLASGTINKQQAKILAIICLFSAVFCLIATSHLFVGLFFLCAYFLLNMIYTFGLKDKPVIDVIILASGFIIRVFYGAMLTNTKVSVWLYLMVLAGSLYMGLGKRRNEMHQENNTRTVLKYYTYAFLDKNMYVCVTLVNVFYSLWAMEFNNSKMLWTVPLIIIILMKYSLTVEGNSDGDPVEVLLRDKILAFLVFSYILFVFILLYVI